MVEEIPKGGSPNKPVGSFIPSVALYVYYILYITRLESLVHYLAHSHTHSLTLTHSLAHSLTCSLTNYTVQLIAFITTPDIMTDRI